VAESAVGRQTLAKNAATSRAFQYDDLDRPISIYDSAFGTARRVYDADGRVVQAVYPDGAGMGYPEGLVTTYQYDARGAVVGISDPIGGTWQLDYDAAGRPIHETSRFGIDREIAYTSEGFVDEITLRNSAGAYLEVFDYGSYDALGNPGQIKTCEGMASCSASPTGTTTIGYDALSRVTSVSYPGSSESFGYDRAGNRRTHTVNGTLRSLDVADELTAIRQGATVLESFTYDLAGRRQTRTAGGATTTYTYDPLGRLQVLVTPATGQSNVVGYDALDTRYLAWDAQTKRTDYALGEWAEMRGSERVRLVHGPGIDAVRAEVSSTTARALQTDAGGNVVLATVGDAISETRRYGAFGTVRASSGTQTISRGFAGRPSEGTTGLVSLRARHYDPATGRFLQPDPLGIETDQLYAYAANNPYVFSDPMGLMPSSLAQWGAAGRGFAFGAGTALGTSYAIGTGARMARHHRDRGRGSAGCDSGPYARGHRACSLRRV
jgi:RHS repeat-associated protein